MNILITGASSQIGRFLLPLLVGQGHACLCISRSEHADTQGVRWLKADINTDMAQAWQACEADAWIHLAFLPLAVPHLEVAASSGVRRFIGFSSTSIFTKQTSDSSEEQQTIQQLTGTEASVQSICQRHGIGWTLFRPTMIYGCGMDQNIAFIHQVIERFGCFPVAGSEAGLRQPVHAEDLAKACLAAFEYEQTMNKAYNLSGGEVLSYREMVERIFRTMNRHPRIIRLPASVYKFVINVLKRVSRRYAFVQTSMVDRMNMDMVFDHADATHDFGYDPRPFQP